MSNRGSAAARSGAAPARWLGGRAGRGRRASNGPGRRAWDGSIPGLVNIEKTMGRSTMLLMGKSTISMAIFHCYVSSPEGKISGWWFQPS